MRIRIRMTVSCETAMLTQRPELRDSQLVLFFSQVLGGVGLGRGEARLSGGLTAYWTTALVAELGTGWQFRSTGSAGRGQTPSAFQAED
jgi:hypothetical protein